MGPGVVDLRKGALIEAEVYNPTGKTHISEGPYRFLK